MLPSCRSFMALPKLIEYVVSGLSSSSKRTIRVLPLSLKTGLFSIGGEISTFLVGLSSVTYSSKVICIVLPVKLTELLLGEVESTTGGVSSLGPPVGDTTLAQRSSKNDNINNTICLTIFLMLQSYIKNHS